MPTTKDARKCRRVMRRCVRIAKRAADTYGADPDLARKYQRMVRNLYP